MPAEHDKGTDWETIAIAIVAAFELVLNRQARAINTRATDRKRRKAARTARKQSRRRNRR